MKLKYFNESIKGKIKLFRVRRKEQTKIEIE